VVNPATLLLGPLAGCECRRAIARGWLILARTLAAAAILTVALFVFWSWWLLRQADPFHFPYQELRYGLVTVEGLLVTAALAITPALTAGALAGEKERGALGLLLTTRVSPREIVAGRLAGKLAQVGMILLAMAPAVILIAAIAGFHPVLQATMLALPAATAIGCAGLAAGVSASTRRARDAMMTTYLLVLIALISGVISFFVPPAVADWIIPLNPYTGLGAMAWDEAPGPSALSVLYWTAIGLLGTCWASLRLVPASLAHADGPRIGRAGRRRGAVPPVGERPMLWKEFFIERAAALGGLGWWIGAAVTILLGPGSLILGLFVAWHRLRAPTGALPGWADWALRIGVGRTGTAVSWLIQWGIGLRAAVAIASEREKGTWDAILTSPLESREIVLAKLWGCLHALRWLVVAAMVAWTVAWAAGAIEADDYFGWVVDTLCVGTFMAAVGLRASLTASTATRASAVTIGAWLGAMVVAWIVGGITVTLATIIYFFSVGITVLGTPGATIKPSATALRWLGVVTSASWTISTNALYLVVAAILLGTTLTGFDLLAGRLSGFAIPARRAPSPKPVPAPLSESPGDP
jgi:ABC-type transport system involved in multi-copper enzyme maturation permease subunit